MYQLWIFRRGSSKCSRVANKNTTVGVEDSLDQLPTTEPGFPGSGCTSAPPTSFPILQIHPDNLAPCQRLIPVFPVSLFPAVVFPCTPSHVVIFITSAFPQKPFCHIYTNVSDVVSYLSNLPQSAFFLLAGTFAGRPMGAKSNGCRTVRRMCAKQTEWQKK